MHSVDLLNKKIKTNWTIIIAFDLTWDIQHSAHTVSSENIFLGSDNNFAVKEPTQMQNQMVKIYVYVFFFHKRFLRDWPALCITTVKSIFFVFNSNFNRKMFENNFSFVLFSYYIIIGRGWVFSFIPQRNIIFCKPFFKGPSVEAERINRMHTRETHKSV